MDAAHAYPADETDSLQRYLNDLTMLLASPSMQAGGDPSQIVRTLLDALVDMLRLDFIYLRLTDPVGFAPAETLRSSATLESQSLSEILGQVPEGDRPPTIIVRIAEDDVSVVRLAVGPRGEIGELIAGSRRANFPDKAERLVLTVASSQTAIAIQSAIAVGEQRRITGELERELAAHIRTEDELRASERGAQLVVDGIPALVIVASSSGAIERTNQQALNYFGEGLKASGEWPSRDLIHPHDFDRTAQVFADSIASGDPCELEHRLRRHDGASRWFQTRALPVKGTTGRIEHWYVLLTDIDERKRVEDQLRARELSVRLLVESMESIPAFAIVSNEVGEIVFANRQVLAYYGRTLEEVKAWPMSAHIVHPDDLEHANQVVADSLRAGVRYEDEYRLQRHDGVYRWFEGRGMPVRDENGRVINWHVLLIDIDDRKRAERLLAAENRMLEMVARGQPLSVLLDALCRVVEEIIDDCACAILLVDAVGKRLELGAAPNILPTYFASAYDADLHSDSGPCAMAALQKAHVIVSDVESETRWDSERRKVPTLPHGFRSCWATPILSRTQTALGTFAIYRRMPGTPTALQRSHIDQFAQIASIAIERAHSDEAVRRSEALLAEGQRLSLTGTFAWRTDSNEIRFSKELYRIFEFEPNSLVTLERVGRRLHPNDVPLLQESVERARVEGAEFEIQLRLQIPNDQTRYVRTIARSYRNDDGQPEFLGAVQDISESRFSEEALSKVRSELAHMARVTSLNALTASIAHEVNQPLSGIITNAGTSLRMLGAEPPNIDGARETARRTIRDANRASAVIDRLRVLFTKKDPVVEPVDINDAAQDVIALSQHELGRNKIALRTEFAGSLPTVQGDRVQIQQVILNLLLNAGDAMNGVEDRARQIVVRTTLDTNGSVRVTVADNGPGIDPLIAERLFETFFSTKSSGMGIGLSISRSIIEQHGGRLWVEQNKSPGASFSFSIPPQATPV